MAETVESFDVVVVGLGVIGSACTLEFARRGMRVMGIDRFEQGHTSGSSHGGSRLFREFHAGNPGLTRLAADSREAWDRLASASGHDLFRPTGGLFVGLGSDDGWMDRVAEMQSSAVNHEVLADAELRRIVPGLNSRQDSIGLYEPAAGVLLAETCLQVLQDEAVRAGATLHFETPGHLADPDAVETTRRTLVQVGDTRLWADAVVVATGPWTGSMGLGERSLELTVERAVVHWIDSPSAQAMAEMPFVIVNGQDELFCMVPWLVGQGLKFGRFHTGDFAFAPDELSKTVRLSEAAHDTALLNHYLPSLQAERPSRSGICRYTHSVDASFGLDFAAPGVLVVNACNGQGFKFAPVLGEIVADLITTGHTLYDTSSLRLSGA